MQESGIEEELMEAFKVFDRDGNGKISAHELRFVMSTSDEELNENDIEELIREIDKNGDGFIDYHEFVLMMMAQ